MSLKIISRRPAHPSLETIAGDGALPRLSAGDCGHALPSSVGGADAKQPGETASRLLRIVPASPESAICWESFAVLKSLFSPAELPANISLYLFNMEQRLLQVARSRAERDFRRVAREAQAIGRIAGNLGALHVRAAAHQLADACQAGDHAATYSVLSGLSQACDEAGAALNDWLAHHSAINGA